MEDICADYDSSPQLNDGVNPLSNKEAKTTFESQVALISKEILQSAQNIAKTKRNCSVILKEDIEEAVKRYKSPSLQMRDLQETKWFYIPIKGNGSCLFISIRVAMELSYILKQIAIGDPKSEILIDGNHPDMLKAAENVRQKIVNWYRKKLNAPVPILGNFLEGPQARLWTRGDIIAMEIAKKSSTLSKISEKEETEKEETKLERENAILEYLLNMSQKSTWGSNPEFIAAACMTKRTVKIFQKSSAHELKEITTVKGEGDLSENQKVAVAGVSTGMGDDDEDDTKEEDSSYNLYFDPNRKHYEVLVTHRQYKILKKAYGSMAIQNIKPFII
jgi:hypothetical protein